MKTSGLHINNTLNPLTERLEVKYIYLPHGPLARVELGKKSIQGLDYAYTLQGWLKDINGFRNDISSTNVYDIGKDGSATNYTNKRFGRDGFATMLQYYTGDYIPINGNNYFNLGSPNSVGLYNGNISALSLGIDTLNPMLKSFRYDKLNRIKMMESAYLSNNIWGVLSNRFGTEYSYDFNGNITNLSRRDETATLLHDIGYTYEQDRNRLRGIEVNGTEIRSSSYHYDALGNLITDDIEEINVDWNVIGKVKFVQTPNNRLNFAYNPFGQRQIKRTDNDTTYYVHDATGNVMGIYVKDDLTITANERPIYGSSRLGIMNKAVVFNMNGGLVSKSNSTIGIKEYELNDHLGNVSVVVLDRKKSLSTNIQPIIKYFTDYYPFGYQISDRTNSSEYRYGFNGKEYDNEIYNTSNFQDYGMRLYDTRIARFWGVDPLKSDYPMLTPFQFASNSPIWAIDLDGLEAYIVNGKFDRWGPIKGAEAPVIVIKKAGDLDGVTLKNNSKDYFGQNITVAQFYKRAQRVYAEGGTYDETAQAYVNAQDNKREAAGGNEIDNYYQMEYPNFDVYSPKNSYKRWNDIRGTGYSKIENLNNLAGADAAVNSVVLLLMGLSFDSTYGATQWRGQKGPFENVMMYFTKNIEVPFKALGTGSKGNYVDNVTTIVKNGSYHIFFNFTKTKPETNQNYEKLPKDCKNHY